MRKIIIILLILFSFSNTVFAEETIEDKNAREIAIMASRAISNVGEGYIKAETIEKITFNIVGTLTRQLSNKFFTRTYRKGFNKYISEVISKGSFEKMLSKRFTSTFKSDILWIPTDIFIEFMKEYTMKRSNIADKYKQPAVWWLDILYTDLKASLNPNKIAGAVDFTVGNGKVLADMANKINQQLKTLGKLKWDVAYSEARYKINSYETEGLEEYTKARTLKERKKVLENFKLKVQGEKVFGDIFSTGYRDVFNQRIEGLKFTGIKHIETFEKNKFQVLLFMLKNNDYTKYRTYIDTYFPSDISYFLGVNYQYFYKEQTISTVKRNTAIFHYVIKMLSWGFTLDDFGILYMGHVSNDKVPKYIAYNVISKMYSIIYSIPNGDHFSAEFDSFLSRKDFAEAVNSKLNLKQYLTKADIENIEYLTGIYSGLSYDILVFNKLGIIKGDIYETDFRDNDKLTSLELMIMIERIITYVINKKEN